MDEQEIYNEQVRQALNQYYRGMELEKKRDLEGAKTAYQQSLEIKPLPRTYMRLAVIEIFSGNLDEAERHVDQALWLSPGFQMALQTKRQIGVQRRITAQLSGEAPSSDPTAQQPAADNEIVAEAVEETPMQAQPVETVPAQPLPAQPQPVPAETGLLGEAKQAAVQGNWQQSLESAQRYVEENPSSAEGYYHTGLSYYQLKNYTEAEAAYRKAVELKPDFSDAYNDLGITLELTGRSAEAVSSYQKAIEIGGNGDAYFNLALLEEKRGDYPKAIGLYENYLKFDPNSAFSEFARERIQKLRRQEY